MLSEKLEGILENYPYGLTLKEIQRALRTMSVKSSLSELRDELASYPSPVAGVERYGLGGVYELPAKPCDVEVTYLANRRVKIRKPEDKARVKKLGSAYYAERNYQIKSAPFLNAFRDTCQRGHQLVLGGFFRAKSARNQISVKARECLSYVQCLMVEFDEDLGYSSLEEMAQKNDFIRENACLLMESVSGFPKSRAFFMLPFPATMDEDNTWGRLDFVIRMLLAEFDGKADASGTNPANGSLGIEKGDYIVLNQWLSREVLTRWARDWERQPKQVPKQMDIEKSDLSQLPEEYRNIMKVSSPDAHGWYGRYPCPHEDHEHDGWAGGSNACSILPKGRGFLTACWKCEREDVSKPKFRYIGKDKMHDNRKSVVAKEIATNYEAEEEFVRGILDGTLDVPEPIEIPSWAEQEESRIKRVKRGEASPLELIRPSAILEKSRDVQDVITLLESDAKIARALAMNNRIIGLNAPTGAGKDERHMAMVVEHELHSIETKPHHLVAREKTERWQERASAARWVGITAGMDEVEAMHWEDRIADPFPESSDWKCIQPRRVWNYMQRGGNRHLGICSKCPVQDTCNIAGYNGQAAWVKQQRAIVLAIPQLFVNPIFESFSEKLYHVSPRDEEVDAQESTLRLAVMDEEDAFTLFLECELSLAQLQIWRNMWGEEDLAVFAARLENILLNGELTDLKDYIESINETVAESICDQMHHVREPYELIEEKTIDPDTGDELGVFKLRFRSGNLVTLAVNRDAVMRLKALELPNLHIPEVQRTGHVEMTLDQAFAIGVYGAADEMDGEAILSRLPRTYSKEWNPFKQLQKLFERYPAESAPISLDGANDAMMLTWEVAPQLHEHIKRLICMSATLDEELFRRAFSEYADDLEFVRVEPTPLVEGSQIFQIRTGKYCRGTVLDVNGNRQLHGTGMKLWEMFKSEVLRDPDATHALVTYQSVIDNHVEWLDEQENIIEYANFFGLEGINSMQEADYVWVVFDPELNDTDIRRYAKQFYGDDETPLDFTREDGRYVDERVYRVWHASVVGELLQAVGRARLNRVQGTIVLLTGVEIPAVTNRKETLIFDLKDWEVDKDLTLLEARIRQRELSEACFEAHEDVIMADIEDGMSQREVQRKYGAPLHWIRKVINKYAA